MLSALPRYQKLLLIFGGLAVVLIGVGVYLYHINNEAKQRAQAARDKVQAHYDEEKAMADRLPELRAERTELAGKLSYLWCLRFDQPEYMPALLRWLRDLALADRVEVKALRPTAAASRAQKEATSGPVRAKIPVNVTVTGTYSAIYRFIQDLKRFPMLISLGDVKVAASVGRMQTQTATGARLLDATLASELNVLPQVEVGLLGSQTEEASTSFGGAAGGAGGGAGIRTAPPEAAEESGGTPGAL